MKNHYKKGKCDIADHFVSNKKITFCKNCTESLKLENETVCIHLLDEKY